MAAHHTGDHVRAADPVGLSQVSRGPLRGMIGMRVVEPNNIQPLFPGFPLDSDKVFRINRIAVAWGIRTCVRAWDRRNRTSTIGFKATNEHATTLFRIHLLSVTAECGMRAGPNKKHGDNSRMFKSSLLQAALIDQTPHTVYPQELPQGGAPCVHLVSP